MQYSILMAIKTLVKRALHAAGFELRRIAMEAKHAEHIPVRRPVLIKL
jgi:hypothetical protein